MFKIPDLPAHLWRVALMLGLLGLAQLVQAERPTPPPLEERRYEDNFTFKYQNAFPKDPWTWGYTREFAERFRMPEQWIEPEMTGVLAVAFRVTDLNQSRTCGLGGREDNCWTGVMCQFDIYYDSAIELPWIKEAVTRDNFLLGNSSQSFLWEYPPQIALRYDANPVWPHRGPNAGDYGPLPLRIGFDNDAGQLRHFPQAFTYYDRDYAPGVGLIGIEYGPCELPFRQGRIRLDFFANRQAQEKSKGMPRDQLKAIGLVHEALVPDSFMQRAETARLRDIQEQKRINDRLIRDFQQRQQSGPHR